MSAPQPLTSSALAQLLLHRTLDSLTPQEKNRSLPLVALALEQGASPNEGLWLPGEYREEGLPALTPLDRVMQVWHLWAMHGGDIDCLTAEGEHIQALWTLLHTHGAHAMQTNAWHLWGQVQCHAGDGSQAAQTFLWNALCALKAPLEINGQSIVDEWLTMHASEPVLWGPARQLVEDYGATCHAAVFALEWLSGLYAWRDTAVDLTAWRYWHGVIIAQLGVDGLATTLLDTPGYVMAAPDQVEYALIPRTPAGFLAQELQHALMRIGIDDPSPQCIEQVEEVWLRWHALGVDWHQPIGPDTADTPMSLLQEEARSGQLKQFPGLYALVSEDALRQGLKPAEGSIASRSRL